MNSTLAELIQRIGNRYMKADKSTKVLVGSVLLGNKK